MVDIYTFEIHSLEFDRIISGKKTAHLLLNEPKCKDYAVGNQITFKRNVETFSDEQKDMINDDNSSLILEIKASISNLLYFNDFVEAVNTLGKETCGFKASATIEKTSDLSLASDSFENVEKYGVVAIVFEVIGDDK